MVGVVDGGQLAIRLPGPSARVTTKATRFALDFDKKESLRREDQEIDFVDAAIVRDEFEVRPGSVGFVVRKL